jgi:hypothetical protein
MVFNALEFLAVTEVEPLEIHGGLEASYRPSGLDRQPKECSQLRS